MNKSKQNFYFSIIIPAYNCENTIIRCVDSILEQTYSNFEIIIVDDGSTDNTYNLCSSLTKNNEKIRALHKKHGGPNSARQYGVMHALYDYIICVDSDDWIESNMLNESNMILGKQETDLILFLTKEIYNKNIRVSQWKGKFSPITFELGYYNKEKLHKYVFPEIFNIGNPIHASWASVFKKSLLIKNLQYNQTDYGEDFITLYNCIFDSESVYFSDSVMYNYDNSKCNNKTNYYRSSLNKNMQLYRIIFNTLYNKNRNIDIQLEKSLLHNIWYLSNYHYGKSINNLNRQTNKFRLQYFSFSIDQETRKYIKNIIKNIKHNKSFNFSERVTLFCLKNKLKLTYTLYMQCNIWISNIVFKKTFLDSNQS